MIKVENIDVWGFEHAIRGMRNPLNSWQKSDSYQSDFTDDDKHGFVIGPNDMDLMRRLYKAGPEHRKYLRQIFVSMDITAPLYWISELDTYKIGVTRNSCSFMHKGVSKPFDINDFSIHNEEVYDILNPLETRTYELMYPYETKEFRTYTTSSGRKYDVYRNGRVFAHAFTYTDTYGRTRHFDEREITPYMNQQGYYFIRIGGGNSEHWAVHRLVATMWVENPNNYATVDHIDGNKGNNSIENLQWLSREENIRKGFIDGFYGNLQSLHSRYLRWKRGHTLMNPFSEQELRMDKQKGLSYQELMKKYDLSYRQVNNVLYSATHNESSFMEAYTWERVLSTLNDLRNEYLITRDEGIFQAIRSLLPCGYEQKATYTMNYENVMNMINQRETHRLDEWRDGLVPILKSLPYIKEIRGESDG